MNRFLSFLFAFALVTSASQAQFRKYSNEFLAIGVGARSLGMSGAQVASVNDVYGTYWNPAALNNVDGSFSAAFMHSEYFAGIAKYDYGAVALPVSGDKKLAFSLIRFGVDDIPNTLFLKEPDGTINYDNVTSFSAADYAFFGSFAGNVKTIEGLQYGASAKVVHRIVGKFAQSWGVGLDVGAQYQKKNWLFGAMLRDVTTTYNAWSFDFTQEEADVLLSTGNVVPTNSSELTAPRIILGTAYNWNITPKIGILPEVNLELTTDGKRNVLIPAKPFSIDPKVGLEANYAKVIFLRGGVGNFQKATSDIDLNKEITTLQPNIGVGLKIKAVSIDYALTDLGNLSQSLYSHVFSVKLDINKKI